MMLAAGDNAVLEHVLQTLPVQVAQPEEHAEMKRISG